MIRAVIFDFDGVICESADIKTRAFERLFEVEFPAHAEAAVAFHLANEGISRFVKFRHVREELAGLPPDDAEERRLGERFSAIVFEEICAAPFVPGALEFLRANNAAARPLFVASGTPQGELDLICRQRGITDLFAEVRGTPDTKAAIIADVVGRYGLDRSETAFVGDAESDRAAAAATGLRFVARCAPGSGKCLEAEAVIEDLTTLEAALADLAPAGPDSDGGGAR